MRRWRDRAWPPSRIGVRLLAFNLLVVFVPVVGVLYLDVYEERLLEAQERKMEQQGWMLAAASAGEGALDVARITAMLARLNRETDARLRIYDIHGTLVADSARVPQPPQPPRVERYGETGTPPAGDVRGRLLYRLGAWIANARQGIRDAARALLGSQERAPSVEPPRGTGGDPEVRAALQGRYGAATRRTLGQRSLTLSSAVPVRDSRGVIGAVVVSQSTFKVLQAIYDVRLRIFEVVVASIAAAALLTTLAATTIVRPLRRLRRQASALAERRGPMPVAFPGAARKDELGDLARALEDLTRRLNEQIKLLEGFAADVSHEFKNPLASIRTAAEMMEESDRPEDRTRFLSLMLRDVDRLERIVTGLRDMARMDRELGDERHEAVDIADVLRQVIDGIQLAGRARNIDIALTAEAVVVAASRERLVQVFENLLSNAISFAPEGSKVDVTAAVHGTVCTVSVADHGAGIPEAHLNRIFERFFTYRPAAGRGDHIGLGLAIARRIIEDHGGTLTARNRPGGGAVFDARFPSRRPTQARLLAAGDIHASLEGTARGGSVRRFTGACQSAVLH